MLIVGTGAAGLSAAVAASAAGRRVVLLCKRGLDGGSTPLAQGGLAAVLDPADSLRSHREDTLRAGAGLSDSEAVRDLVAAAPHTIRSLQNLGARFDTGSLGLEGGHAHARIVHAGGDASGVEVHRVLLRAAVSAHVEILDDTVAMDAVTDDAGSVRGIVAARVPAAPGAPLDVGLITANAVVLASGGLGQAYATTTNPLDSTGDGLALAARAGAEIVDVEFVQFHPTVLYQAGRRGQCALITEALRGAGAVLIDHGGRSVMAGRHAEGDLAPRDIVAFAMHQRMVADEDPSTHLWLDARSLGASRFEREFPTVRAACRSLGIDPSRELIPVAPGAHYSCGGVRADMDGRTSLAGLYAIGEVAATGVHGANRLASNSLTEAVMTGERLGRLLGNLGDQGSTNSRSLESVHLPSVGLGSDPNRRLELTTAMSAHAGIVRSRPGLESLLDQLARIPEAPPVPLDLATVEATNLRAVSTLIANAALIRDESRGSHRRSDFSHARPDWTRRVHLRMVDGKICASPGVTT